MEKCVDDNCEYFKQYGECSSVCLKNGFNKIITNFDRIKNMSIEEMAEFLLDYDCDFDCWGVMGVAKPYKEEQKEEALKAQIEWLNSRIK